MIYAGLETTMNPLRLYQKVILMGTLQHSQIISWIEVATMTASTLMMNLQSHVTDPIKMLETLITMEEIYWIYV